MHATPSPISMRARARVHSLALPEPIHSSHEFFAPFGQKATPTGGKDCYTCILKNTGDRRLLRSPCAMVNHCVVVGCTNYAWERNLGCVFIVSRVSVSLRGDAGGRWQYGGRTGRRENTRASVESTSLQVVVLF